MKSSTYITERGDRGQTTLDFAFGIAVFLVAVVFIFMFLPSLIAPFNTPGEDGDRIQVERTADYLIGHVLVGDQENSHVTTLDPACTDAFFELRDPPSRCGFTDEIAVDGDLDPTALGLDSSTHLRVQLQSVDGAETPPPVGESPPTVQNVQQWSRLVYISGDAYELTVQMW